jgi:Conserved TM helix
MGEVLSHMLSQMYEVVPRIIGAVLLLVVGMIVAAIVRSAVRGLLERVQLERVAGDMGLSRESRAVPVLVSKIAYYFVFLIVLLGVFQILHLELISLPLQAVLNKVAGALPNIFEALLILVLAWVIAVVLRTVFARVLAGIGFDRRAVALGLLVPAGSGPSAGQSPSQMIGQVAFYLVLLFALPGILAALNMSAISQPLETLLTRLSVFVPNLVGAALTIFIGVLLARIVRGIVTNGLAALGADRLARRVHAEVALGAGSLSGLAGWAVYYLIVLWAIIAGLNNLQLEAISQPLAQMMALIVGFLPRLAAAALVVIVGVIVGRLLREFTTGLLTRTRLDAALVQLGVTRLPGGGDPGRLPPIVGSIVMTVVVLLFAAEALDVMRLELLTNLASQLLLWLPQVLIGLLILGVGVAVANWTERRIREGVPAERRTQRVFLALGARYAILAFVLAGALQQMGIAREVVVLAFGLAFGSVCLGLALAFGLGSREVAGEVVRQGLQSR